MGGGGGPQNDTEKGGKEEVDTLHSQSNLPKGKTLANLLDKSARAIPQSKKMGAPLLDNLLDKSARPYWTRAPWEIATLFLRAELQPARP